MLDALFVYGTLRSGGGHNWRISEGAVLVGQARMAGRLYRLGGYPGLVRNGFEGERVLGEVYRLSHPERLLVELDAYEGDEYAREIATAVLDSGVTFDCWVYVYIGVVDEAMRMGSGNFLA